MLGALIGDIVGSRFEFNNIKTKDFELFTSDSTYTDDTVMTLAVCDVLQSGNVFNKEKIIDTFKKWGRTYPNAGYGGMFYKWLFSDMRDSYNSYGNGAAMRISAVGWYANSEEEVKTFSKAVTEVTHSHKEGLKGAEVVAMCIYYARCSKSKEFIKDYVSKYYDLNFNYDDLVKNYYHGEEICQVTVPQAIYCFLISKDFEDCLRTTISIGGDCDTTAAISCAIAEAYYKYIDENIIKEALKRLPPTEDNCNVDRIIHHYFGDRRFLYDDEEEITNDTKYLAHKRKANKDYLVDFDYSSSLQKLVDLIFYEFLSSFIGNYDNDLAEDLLDEGNFLGFVETLMYSGVKDLEPIKDIYLRSQNMKDFNSFKQIIQEVNKFIRGYDEEFIIFDDLDEVLDYLKENSVDYPEEVKNLINQSYYLKK